MHCCIPLVLPLSRAGYLSTFNLGRRIYSSRIWAFQLYRGYQSQQRYKSFGFSRAFVTFVEEMVNTTERLAALRKLMKEHEIDVYGTKSHLSQIIYIGMLITK